MSYISGTEQTLNMLSLMPEALKVELQAAGEANIKQMQIDAVATVPVDEGNLRDHLASPDALVVEHRAFGFFAKFGFLTLAAQKKCYYAIWVEQGNKAHDRGAPVERGRDRRSKSGRMKRAKRRKRSVPARPAQPFFRPAFERFQERMAKVRNEIALKAVKKVREQRKGWW